MTQGGGPAPGLAADVAREVAERARSLGSRLDGREPGELLEDVRDFARRRPGMFLLGALAAGMVAGRLVKGATEGVAGAAVAADRSRVGQHEPLTTGPTYGQTGTVGTPAVPSPPIPPSTPGQPTIEPHGDALEEAGPMGTPASGYGERPGLGGERP